LFKDDNRIDDVLERNDNINIVDIRSQGGLLLKDLMKI